MQNKIKTGKMLRSAFSEHLKKRVGIHYMFSIVVRFKQHHILTVTYYRLVHRSLKTDDTVLFYTEAAIVLVNSVQTEGQLD